MQTFSYPSKSRPTHNHTVTVADGGQFKCTCESYMYCPLPQRCKHTDDALGIKALPKGQSAISSSAEAHDRIPIDPMLASKPKGDDGIEDFPSDLWVLEEKFDGHRIILVTKEGKEPVAWSRLGNVRPLPPHLVSSLKTSAPSGMFDTEMYVPGGTSTDVKALDQQAKLRMVFFDVLKVENASTMELPGHERRKFLDVIDRKWKTTEPAGLSVAEQFDPSYEILHEMWNRGGEGAILKRRDAKYEAGKRSKNWIKLKKKGSEETTVLRLLPGSLGPYSVIECQDDNGIVTTVKSLNDAWRAEFAKNPSKYIGARFVISFQDRTRDGNFHHPMADHFVDFDLK